MSEEADSNDDKPDGDCIIPPEIPKTELRNLVFKQSEHEVREITDYVEWQCNKGDNDEEEIVQHAEKLVSERVIGRKYDVWDVHTNLSRWWVITNPTNLYSQTLMPSLDYTLSFHVGLMARVMSKREPEGGDAERELLMITTRKLVQAGEAFDAADEVEEFQAVGMRCREAMTSFVREILQVHPFEELTERPKTGDFVGWSEKIIGLLAGGGSAETTRGYLKAIASKGWQLVNWLTHAKNATRDDAELALSLTEHVVERLTVLVLKSLSAAPARCGKCQSQRITVTWRPGEGDEGGYVARCDSCGAEARRGDGDAQGNTAQA